MIGINSLDIAKVWLNSKFSKNLPDSMRLKTENEMILTIIDVVDKNTQQNGVSFNIKEFLIKKNPQTFTQAQQLLIEFCNIYNLQIPAKLNCIS